MVLQPQDMEFRLSGGVTNINPHGSLGGIISDTCITDAIIQNLFDDITAAELSGGDTEYRCLYVINTNPDYTINAHRMWIETVTPLGYTSFAFALDLAGRGDGVSTGVADTITDESTAPSPAVTFASPTDYDTGTLMGALGPDAPSGAVTRGVWIRRTVTSGSAAPFDSVMFRIEGT